MKKLAFYLVFLFCGSLLAGDEISTPHFSRMPENDLQNFEAVATLELAYPRQPDCCDPKEKRGRRGARGAPGLDGDPGATGPAGATGALGATGSAGSTGALGATGPAGSTGAAGTTGAFGSIGPAGSTGAQGSTGTSASLASIGAFINSDVVLFPEVINFVPFDQDLGEYDPNGIITFVPPDSFTVTAAGFYQIQFTANLNPGLTGAYTPDITIGTPDISVVVNPVIAPASEGFHTVSVPAILNISPVPTTIQVSIQTNSAVNRILGPGTSIFIQKLN